MGLYSHSARSNLKAVGFDAFLVALIFAKEFVFDFLGFGFALNAAVCSLILLRILGERWKLPLYVHFLGGAMLASFVAALALDGSAGVALGNYMRLLQVALYAAYFLFLAKTFKVDLGELFERASLLFNGMFFANYIAIFFQYVTPGSFVAVSPNQSFSFEDSLSGLFGPASTHAVVIYSCFVILYNLHKAASSRPGGALKYVVLAIVEAVVSVVFSTLNDNKALLLYLVLTAILFLCVFARGRAVHRFFPILLACVALLAVLFVALMSVPSFKAFVDVNLTRNLGAVVQAWNLHASVNGSDERIQIIHQAMVMPTTWIAGVGMGGASIYEPDYLGYANFGQTDFGSVAILGGVWLYAAFVYFYARTIASAAGADAESPSLCAPLFLLVLLTTMYSQPLTQVRIAIPSMLLGFLLARAWGVSEPAEQGGHGKTMPELPSAAGEESLQFNGVMHRMQSDPKKGDAAHAVR